MEIWIDGKPWIVRATEAGLYGWIGLFVRPSDDPRSLNHARHLVPASWAKDPHAAPIRTGGHLYSKRAPKSGRADL